MSMSFKDLATSRYSVRKYSDRPVEKEKLDLILEVARIAPTAQNRQPQRIRVLQTPEELAKVDSLTRSRFGAPLVLLVCYDESVASVRGYDNLNGGQIDATIVTDQMMMQATELGLGSVWVGGWDPKKTSEVFELPENIIPSAMLMLGYAAPDCVPSERHFQRNSLDQMLI